ncbi:MarR family transcriptional regulator [Aquibium sp. LZ166]|uniref:MarR family transcriptional regulator n=1 Tax=Aquibium pacificus TaxID=3153579 RepID=A0ABV3SL90_9HYPH
MSRNYFAHNLLSPLDPSKEFRYRSQIDGEKGLGEMQSDAAKLAPEGREVTENLSMKLSHQICFALYSTSRAITNTYRPLLDELGLTYPQYLVMLVLWEDERLNVGQIGDRLMLDSGTLTPLLKRLEGRGLITRKREQNDERQVNVGLTPAGEVLRESAMNVVRNIACKLAMTGEEFVQLHAQLARLKDNIAGLPPEKGSSLK